MITERDKYMALLQMEIHESDVVYFYEQFLRKI